jgi:hypothetical protein
LEHLEQLEMAYAVQDAQRAEVLDQLVAALPPVGPFARWE